MREDVGVDDRLETYEVGSPWITYVYLTTDRQTRLTGRSKIRGECAICGTDQTFVLRIPRVGPVPEPQGGRNPERVGFVREHQHTAEQRGDRTTWAKPLRNPAGLTLDVFADVVGRAVNDARVDRGEDQTTDP